MRCDSRAADRARIDGTGARLKIMAARSIGTASISFGLVTVPVRIYSMAALQASLGRRGKAAWAAGVGASDRELRAVARAHLMCPISMAPICF